MYVTTIADSYVQMSNAFRSHSHAGKNYAYASRAYCHTTIKLVRYSNLLMNGRPIVRVTQLKF